MSSKADISHEGKVVAVNPQFTTVEITSSAACASCHAAGLCGMGEVQEKAIQVPTALGADYAVGEPVEVVLKATMGSRPCGLPTPCPLLSCLRSCSCCSRS
ncbi:MAG: SoxR reducing system RseC family protein, partial [Bacteroidales bacterium]|nr:SoxR reducing system RseC family protein [Bacteroidales bacterium]